MSVAAQYAIALGVVFGVNLLPAFGPPTLVPLTAAFFAGRLVSYSLYVAAASVAERNLGSVAIDSLTSPVGMALQLAMLAGLAVLLGRSGSFGLKDSAP